MSHIILMLRSVRTVDFLSGCQ